MPNWVTYLIEKFFEVSGGQVWLQEWTPKKCVPKRDWNMCIEYDNQSNRGNGIRSNSCFCQASLVE